MWKWFSEQATRLFEWIDNRSGRTIASLVALTAILATCVFLGGVLAQAAMITLSVYVGTLITLNRMRRPVPESASKIYKWISAPFRAFAQFFFRHRLITTISLALLATYMMGFGTVTGIAVAAVCVLTGDILVTFFVDVADWIRERKYPHLEEVKYVEARIVERKQEHVQTAA
jgi:hypothetical protein